MQRRAAGAPVRLSRAHHWRWWGQGHPWLVYIPPKSTSCSCLLCMPSVLCFGDADSGGSTTICRSSKQAHTGVRHSQPNHWRTKMNRQINGTGRGTTPRSHILLTSAMRCRAAGPVHSSIALGNDGQAHGMRTAKSNDVVQSQPPTKRSAVNLVSGEHDWTRIRQRSDQEGSLPPSGPSSHLANKGIKSATP